MKSQNEYEKRYLQTIPLISLNIDSLKTKVLLNYFKELEAYVKDQHGYRNNLINMNLFILTKIFRKTIFKNVIIGKKDWLFYAGENSLEDIKKNSYLTDHDKLKWQDHLLNKFNWLKEKNIEYRFMVAADKHSIYKEFLPKSLSNFKGLSRLDDLLNFIKPKVDEFLINLVPIMLANKVNGTNLYLKTDTHWNKYGAYIGFLKLISSLNYAAKDYKIDKFYNVSFLDGDLAKMINSDIKETYSQPIINLNSWNIIEIAEDEIYTKKAIIPNRTSNFGIYTTLSKGTGKALIFRDSFSLQLLDFLSSYFAEVTYVWCIPDEELFKYLVKKLKPQLVVEQRVERSMQYVPESFNR